MRYYGFDGCVRLAGHDVYIEVFALGSVVEGGPEFVEAVRKVQ